MLTRVLVSVASLLLVTACSSSGGDKSTNPGGAGGKSGGTGGGGAVGVAVPPHTGPEFAGVGCPTELGLPDAYALTNVRAAVDGANVRISFDPLGDAKDYRVYALPAAGDVSGTTVKGATYRCAGRTEVPFPAIEDSDMPASAAVRTRVNSAVGGFARTTADATLGYVFTTPGDDRVPVYALGDTNIKADNVGCYAMRWPETRVKKYTTSEAERTDLLAKRWRDDGIAFYAPKPDAAGTAGLYSADEAKPADFSPKYYVTDGPEHDKRVGDGMTVEPAFSVYTETRDGAEPLMRVFYQQVCGRSHDELVPGVALFNRAYQQGDQPVTELHYSGLTDETTLVVEALDDLCPFAGTLAPMSRPARNNDKLQDMQLSYPQFQTPDELRAASKTGELFVGGQGDGTAPKAISRACVKVKPEAPPKADFVYSGEVETFSDAQAMGFQIWELESPTFNVQFHSVATDEYAVGSLFNEMWVTYADWSADTNGKMRMTPKARATLAADTFVHATMEVDAISTQRRYPQLLISDVEWPVQNNLEQGGTIITQLFGGMTEAMRVQLQFCDHRTWDVNNQCPKYNLDTVKDGDVETLMPHPEVNGYFGVDRTIKFDVYASTARAYVFTNGIPYGCADLPPGKIKAGSATVTFGDVLYHSAVDLEVWYPFLRKKSQILTTRHFSNLTFTSNGAAPAWDESRVPCVPVSGLHE
jgi:Repeat of unknown function (DUF5648)